MLDFLGKLPVRSDLPKPQLVDGSGQPISSASNGEGENLALPSHLLFAALWNTVNKTYSYRWDEAIRTSPKDALAMLNDLSITGPLYERYREVIQQPWAILPEQKEEPEQEQAAELLTTVLERTPALPILFFGLETFVWYGRAAVQWQTGSDVIDGYRRTICKSHAMVNGDKIQFRWDGTPAVYVNSQLTAARLAEQGASTGTPPELGVEAAGVVYGELAPMVLLDRHFRRQFVISKFFPMDADYFENERAGALHGLGLRSMIYWAWWAKNELLTWALNYMQKVGTLGLMVFPYIDGSKEGKARAEQNVQNASNRTAITVPVPPGTDPRMMAPFVVSPSTAGIDALVNLLDKYFDWRIERMIIGQSASSRSDTSGMGTHDTDMQAGTKYRIIKADCDLLGEYITHDLLWPLQEYNLPGSQNKFKLRFKFSVPDPSSKDRMEAAQKAISIGLTIKADEAREVFGFTKPSPDDETLGGQPAAGGPDGAGGGDGSEKVNGGMGITGPNPGARAAGTAKPKPEGDNKLDKAKIFAVTPDGKVTNLVLRDGAIYEFDPSEKRADDGKWTKGGGFTTNKGTSSHNAKGPVGTEGKPLVPAAQWQGEAGKPFGGPEKKGVYGPDTQRPAPLDISLRTDANGAKVVMTGPPGLESPRMTITLQPNADGSGNEWEVKDLKNKTAYRFPYRDHAYEWVTRTLTSEAYPARGQATEPTVYADFEENEHPRANDGKFAEKAGGGVKKKSTKNPVTDELADDEPRGFLYSEGGDYKKLPEALRSEAADWPSELTETERSAVNAYTDYTYVDLNRNTRKCPEKLDCLDGQQKAELAEIEKAIDKFHLPPGLRAWRGVSSSREHYLQLLGAAQAAWAHGGTLTMPGITSYSFSPNKARYFGTYVESESERAMIEIKPKTGAFIEGVTQHGGEWELIQKHNTRFKVLGIKNLPYGDGADTIKTIMLQEV